MRSVLFAAQAASLAALVAGAPVPSADLASRSPATPAKREAWEDDVDYSYAPHHFPPGARKAKRDPSAAAQEDDGDITFMASLFPPESRKAKRAAAAAAQDDEPVTFMASLFPPEGRKAKRAAAAAPAADAEPAQPEKREAAFVEDGGDVEVASLSIGCELGTCDGEVEQPEVLPDVASWGQKRDAAAEPEPEPEADAEPAQPEKRDFDFDVSSISIGCELHTCGGEYYEPPDLDLPDADLIYKEKRDAAPEPAPEPEAEAGPDARAAQPEKRDLDLDWDLEVMSTSYGCSGGCGDDLFPKEKREAEPEPEAEQPAKRSPWDIGWWSFGHRKRDAAPAPAADASAEQPAKRSPWDIAFWSVGHRKRDAEAAPDADAGAALEKRAPAPDAEADAEQAAKRQFDIGLLSIGVKRDAAPEPAPVLEAPLPPALVRKGEDPMHPPPPGPSHEPIILPKRLP